MHTALRLVVATLTLAPATPIFSQARSLASAAATPPIACTCRTHEAMYGFPGSIARVILNGVDVSPQSTPQRPECTTVQAVVVGEAKAGGTHDIELVLHPCVQHASPPEHKEDPADRREREAALMAAGEAGAEAACADAAALAAAAGEAQFESALRAVDEAEWGAAAETPAAPAEWGAAAEAPAAAAELEAAAASRTPRHSVAASAPTGSMSLPTAVSARPPAPHSPPLLPTAVPARPPAPQPPESLPTAIPSRPPAPQPPGRGASEDVRRAWLASFSEFDGQVLATHAHAHPPCPAPRLICVSCPCPPAPASLRAALALSEWLP